MPRTTTSFRSTPLHLNDVLAIAFLDHSQTLNHPLASSPHAKPPAFVVYGRLVAFSRRALTIASWFPLTPSLCTDTDTYTILRSAITSLHILSSPP